MTDDKTTDDKLGDSYPEEVTLDEQAWPCLSTAWVRMRLRWRQYKNVP